MVKKKNHGPRWLAIGEAASFSKQVGKFVVLKCKIECNVIFNGNDTVMIIIQYEFTYVFIYMRTTMKYITGGHCAMSSTNAYVNFVLLESKWISCKTLAHSQAE